MQYIRAVEDPLLRKGTVEIQKVHLSEEELIVSCILEVKLNV